MDVVIIGLGLIGGSVGLKLKKSNLGYHIIGVDNNEQHASRALELGLIDEMGSLDSVVSADLVIICTPVDNVLRLLPGILDAIKPDGVVMDMGSTKSEICTLIDRHPKRKSFVATHPIAGTENSGPDAAFDSLFDGKTGIICDEDKSHESALQVVNKVYDLLKLNVVNMDSASHDLHIAYVSHLSHISSFVLGQTVLEMEEDEKNIFNMAGSGFASTVRLAKSSPAMWAPIFAQNKEHVSQSLETYIKNLTAFKVMVDAADKDNMFASMTKSNKIRKILDGIDIQSMNAEPKEKVLMENMSNMNE